MRLPVTLIISCTMIAALAVSAEDAAAPENRSVMLEHYRELVKSGAENTSNTDLQQQYLETVLALGYYDLAAEQYEKMLEESPDDTALRLALGESWMQTGPAGLDKALETFQKALAINNSNADILFAQAHLYHKQGLYEQAEKYYGEILADDPLHVRARLGKAVLFVRSGEIASASAMLDEIGAAAQPYDVETRTMLRKALFVFERRGGWIEDTPTNHAAYAKLLYRAGRITDAVLAARRAVESDPNDFETWNFIAAMQLQIGNLKNAEQAYGSSLDANPDQPEIAKQRRQLINELSVRSQDKTP